MKRLKYLIIGGGPTGLGAAHRLQELGEGDWLLCEATGHLGGLAYTYKDQNGFLWDIGGHVQFSHYAYFDALMEDLLGKEGWNTIERAAWIRMYQKWIPYPFQNNLHHLPKKVAEECLAGIKERQGQEQVKTNFGTWMDSTFGAGIAKHFMRPYNEKVWAFKPEKLTCDWIGERVSVPDISKLEANYSAQKDDKSWGPNNTFQFPKEGGTGAIWETLGRRLPHSKVFLDHKLIALDLDKKIATFQNGTSFEFGALLSTMPLDQLCSISGSKDLQAQASSFLFSRTRIIGFGFAGQTPEELRDKCWMYFPEHDAPFYRVTVFSNYSENNVPQPGQQWSLMCEISYSQDSIIIRSEPVEWALHALKQKGLVPKDAVPISTFHHNEPKGYPTPFLGRDDLLNTIQALLEKHQVFSRGRFGAWKYEVSNQDHSLMQGVEWVNRMVLGEEEVTYLHPQIVNGS